MAKTSRAMSQTEIAKIVEIIGKFRGKPTWAKIVQKAAEAGIPYKLRALQNQRPIKAAYDKKVQQIRDRREGRKSIFEKDGFPTDEAKIITQLKELQKRVQELEAENRALSLELQTIVVRASEHNVALEELHRPLVPALRD